MAWGSSNHIPNVDRDQNASSLIVIAPPDFQGWRALENVASFMRIGEEMRSRNMSPCDPKQQVGKGMETSKAVKYLPR